MEIEFVPSTIEHHGTKRYHVQSNGGSGWATFSVTNDRDYAVVRAERMAKYKLVRVVDYGER